MFLMILIVMQFPVSKESCFGFCNGRHVFNAFHFVGFASFKSKQCLFLVWIVLAIEDFILGKLNLSFWISEINPDNANLLYRATEITPDNCYSCRRKTSQ